MRLSLLRFVPALLAASLPLAWPMMAYGAGSPSWTYRANGGTVNTPTMAKSAAPGMVFDLLSDGSLKASGALPAVIGGLGTAAMTWARMTPYGRAALFFGPVIAGALSEQVLKDLADLVRCRKSTAAPGSLECDPGQNKTTQTVTQWCPGYNSPIVGQCASTAQGVAEIHRVWFHANKGACGNGIKSPTRFVMLDASSWQLESGVCNGGSGYEPGPYGGANFETQTMQRCPSYLVNGEPFFPSVGLDLKCPRNIYDPHTNAEVEARVKLPGFDVPFKAASDDILRDRYGAGDDLSPIFDNDPVVSGPSTITGPQTTTTTTNPDGTAGPSSTSTPAASITYQGNSYTWNTTTTNTTNNNGTTTTTTTTAPQEIKTCGLPGTPPCKIDETGTPTDAPLTKPKADLDTAGAAASQKVKDGETASPLPWLWGGISLPTGACTNFQIEGPIPAIASREFNICGQPWVAWWRLAWAWFAGLGVVAYGWRRFSDTVEAT